MAFCELTNFKHFEGFRKSCVENHASKKCILHQWLTKWNKEVFKESQWHFVNWLTLNISKGFRNNMLKIRCRKSRVKKMFFFHNRRGADHYGKFHKKNVFYWKLSLLNIEYLPEYNIAKWSLQQNKRVSTKIDYRLGWSNWYVLHVLKEYIVIERLKNTLTFTRTFRFNKWEKTKQITLNT